MVADYPSSPALPSPPVPPLMTVSATVKRLSAGGTVLLLAGAAVAPRGLVPAGLAAGALASAGERFNYSTVRQREAGVHGVSSSQQ